jgi:CPA1 family monovalent cation:H+ antiporter
LAVVSGGLFLSFRSQDIFNSESRIQVLGLWDTLIFLLNGFVFILIGLQLPSIIHGLGNYSVIEAIGYGVIISLVTIVVRIIWVFPGAYIPRWLFKSIRDTEVKPTWKTVFLVAWSGMRGVVSLASALAIPLTLAGAAFPHRNLILFITFIVILFTLVLQGLSLKPLIRILNITTNEKESEKLQALSLRIRLAESVLSYLDTNYPEETQNNETYKRVRDRYERMIEITKRKLEMQEAEEEENSFIPQYREMLLELVHIRRRELNYVRHKGEFNEELIREREWELDLEEERLKR